MTKLVFTFLVSLVCATCTVQKPIHLVYGKWESTRTPKFILSFSDDNLLRFEATRADGKVYESIYHYTINDENSASFFDNSLGDARADITVRIENENKLNLKCLLGKHSDGKSMTDPPDICLHQEFKKVKE